MKFSVNKQRSLWWSISGAVILSGLIAMGILTSKIGTPLRPSLEFIGGTRLQFELDCSKPNNCDRPLDVAQIRTALAPLGLADSSIQVLAKKVQGQDQYGVSISTKALGLEERNKVEAAINQVRDFDPQKIQRDTIGPTLGRQLFSSALLALILSIAGIGIYLTFRFQLDYAFFAFVATIHDVLVTLGAFAILGLVQGTEIDSIFVVSLLTIIGFSVNDTVVIYDRIRETIEMNPNGNITQLIDDAVNQTAVRSFITTFTALLTLFAILLFGGETLKNFALALIIGFVAGAYSSIFVAGTLLSWWRERTAQSKPLTATDTASSDKV